MDFSFTFEALAQARAEWEAAKAECDVAYAANPVPLRAYEGTGVSPWSTVKDEPARARVSEPCREEVHLYRMHQISGYPAFDRFPPRGEVVRSLQGLQDRAEDVQELWRRRVAYVRPTIVSRELSVLRHMELMDEILGMVSEFFTSFPDARLVHEPGGRDTRKGEPSFITLEEFVDLLWRRVEDGGVAPASAPDRFMAEVRRVVHLATCHVQSIAVLQAVEAGRLAW